MGEECAESIIPAHVDESPGRVVISSIPSDSHGWNLVFVDLYLQERGFQVKNLGPCVPIEETLKWTRRMRPALLVIGSINGHGRSEGPAIARAVRADPLLAGVSLVIGGMLATSPDDDVQAVAELLDSGFDAVFTGADAVPRFASFLTMLKNPAHAA